MNRKLLGYRTMLGLNQSELSEQIGMTKSAYCLRETGKREFRASGMFSIMKIINEKFPLITMEEIFFNLKVAK